MLLHIRQNIMLACGRRYFKLRPLGPQIGAARRFDEIGNVRSTQHSERNHALNTWGNRRHYFLLHP
ncbi:MAG: hypothetical protein JWP08_390 [Bryobacterales bacterium]|nr:hypothetical protein [Bryobacterales bacterium]